jgi:hypothetical protein
MSKSTNFQKTTGNSVSSTATLSSDQIIDASGITVTALITNLGNENATQEMLLQNAPSLSGNNTFTGTTNTFNNPIRYDNSIGVGQLSSSKMLVTKEYADGGLSGLLQSSNTWTGSNSFVAGSLQLGKNDNTTAVSAYGNITVQSGSTLTDNGTVVLNGNNQIGKSDNSSTNTIYGPTTCNNNFTVANCLSASTGSLSLSQVPVLQGNYSQPTGNALTTKAYVDSLIPYQPTSDTIIYGQQTVNYQSGGNYVIEAPYLGTSTTSNATGTYFDFYVNFPLTSSSTPTYTLYQNNVTFDFNYWFYQPGNITTTPVSTNNNTATYSSQVFDGTIPKLTGIFGLTNIQATFNVTIRNLALLVHSPTQSTKIWINNTTTSNVQGPVVFTNNYINNSILMTYSAIQFTYINNQKFKVTVGFPNQANNCTKSYWIANLGYSAKLRSSMPCTSSNFAQGNPQLLPNSGVNTNSGGAWISTS